MSLEVNISSKSDFDFNQEIFGFNLIEYCCLCGSANCYRFLIDKGATLFYNCLKFSLIGRNKFIIDECVKVIEPDSGIDNEVIKIQNFEMVMSLEKLFGYEMQLSNYLLNPRVFFYKLSKANVLDGFLLGCIMFKIPGLFEDILSLRATIQLIDREQLLFHAAFWISFFFLNLGIINIRVSKNNPIFMLE